MRIVSQKPTRGVLAVLALLCLATVGFAPAEPGVSVLFVAWDDVGVMADVDVAATTHNGWVKADQQSGGQYFVPNAGILSPDGLKVSFEVTHPTFGTTLIDSLFVPDTVLRLDVVYAADGSYEVFSPDFAPAPSPGTPGDGAPANDDCANATAIGLGTTNGTTSGATVDTVPNQCGTSVTAPGVWYTVVGTGNEMTASTCTDFFGYDTKVSVFCQGCDVLNCLGGNDDNCFGGASGLLSTVSWCSQAGAEYLILVHGFSSGTGDFELNVSDGSSCSGAVECVPPAPTGACCFSDGSCSILSEDDCGTAGGQYQGDDSPCFGGSGSPTNYDSGAVNGAIPDNDPITGLSNTISVGDSTSIADVNVNLNVNHTWTGDLIVTVSHGGTSVEIINRPGVPAISTFGCSEDNWVGLTLDDDAGGGAIEDQCMPNLGGSYTPDNPLAAFNGMDSAGDWTITITDNAAADTGSLVSWSLDIAGGADPTCEPAECFLVIGDDQGSDTYVGANHPFQTQVSDIAESHWVTLTDYPEFVLPMPITQRGFQTTGGLTGSTAPQVDLSNSPEFMQDGSFAIQVLMWNPQVFPGMPEQYTGGLQVNIAPNGKVSTAPYGNDLGGLDVWHEIGRNAEGQPVIRFPFSIPGL